MYEYMYRILDANIENKSVLFIGLLMSYLIRTYSNVVRNIYSMGDDTPNTHNIHALAIAI